MKYYIKIKDNFVTNSISEEIKINKNIDTANWIVHTCEIPIGFGAVLIEDKYNFFPSETQILSWLWHEEGNEWVKTGYVLSKDGRAVKEE